jgi:hypothetical protein
MKVNCKRSTMVLFCLLLAVSIATAKPKNKGKNGRSEGHEANVRAHIVVDAFMESDRTLIREHYRTDHANLPPGLAKKPGGLPPGLAKRNGDLPPGLEKQLQRNGHLPPGLEKKLQPFPVELERRLPPIRSGLMRGMIGGSAVIMDGKTRVILDVLSIF